MNAPHPAEHFTLAEGEKKITYEEDTKIADAGTFTIAKEDHTLGNLLRMSLLSDRRVLFAGYRMPHPLEPRLLLKVKTRPTTEPVQVLLDAVENLQVELTSVEEQFRKAVHDTQQRAHTAMDLL